ncbi:MAG: hypothetical protein AB7O59_24990 [Pirellulales bacterium]
MEAHLLRCAVVIAALGSLGASYRTKNFVVSAPTPELAREIGDTAEKYRRELAQEWLGQPMPNWSQPCPITAQVANHLGAGGATSFYFDHGEVFGWRMTIQGSHQRILDSVLPHEVTHTIFATHFRQPLPRWADEGACTTVEHPSEKAKQQHMLIDFLRTGRGIAFSQMFVMKEYPHDVLPLYSQGYSLARYLVQQGGRRKFLNFLSDGLSDENWTRAIKQHYSFDNLAVLQNQWLDWVRKGSPSLEVAPGSEPSLIAVNPPRTGAAANAVAAAPAPSSAAQAASATMPASPSPPATPAPTALADNGPSIYEQAKTAPEALAAVPSDAQPRWRPRNSQAAASGAADPTLVASAAPAASEPPLPGPSTQYQATRPQPFEKPRQVILEWSRPPGSAEIADRALPGPAATAAGGQ